MSAELPVAAFIEWGAWCALTVEMHIWVQHQPSMLRRRRPDFGWKAHVFHLAVTCIALPLFWLVRLVTVLRRDAVFMHRSAWRGWRAARRSPAQPEPQLQPVPAAPGLPSLSAYGVTEDGRFLYEVDV